MKIIDRTADSKGVSLGDRSSIPVARSGRDLRQGVSGVCDSDGHRSGPNRTAEPWQNPYVERLVGSIRRECLDMIVFNERSLRRILRSYVDYYQCSRTHLALGEDAPITRKVQPPKLGQVIEIPEVGGLHHRYERKAA